MLLRPGVRKETARALFEAYDAFIGVLADDDKRARLKSLSLDELGTDAVFKETTRIAHGFQDGLDRLFFQEDEELRELIELYGVF